MWKTGALSRGDIQRSPCSGAKYKQTRWSSVFRLSRLLLSLQPPTLTMGTVLGPIWGSSLAEWVSGRVQLSLPVKIFWPCRIRYCFFWSFVLKSYDPAHGFLPDPPNRGQRGSPCLNCSAYFDGLAHGCWVCLPVSLPEFSTFWFPAFFFFNFWLRWVFGAVCGLSLVVVSGGYSSWRCSGLSLWWLLWLPSTGSRHTASVAVVHVLSSHGSQLGCPGHLGSSRTRDRTYVSCFGRGILNHWKTREFPLIPNCWFSQVAEGTHWLHAKEQSPCLRSSPSS